MLKYHNRHLRLGEPTLHPSLSMANLHSDASVSTPLASQGWQLTKLESSTAQEQLEVDKEIERLETVLGSDVDEWERRLEEVNRELRGGK